MAEHRNLVHRPATTARDVHLPYSLQTHVGMVLDSGLAAFRYVPGRDSTRPILQNQTKTIRIPFQGWTMPANPPAGVPLISSFPDYLDHDWTSPAYAHVAATVAACLRHGCRPNPNRIEGQPDGVRRFQANIDACRDRSVNLRRLMQLLRSRSRLDLEQAAAAVVSAFVNEGRFDDAELLLRELTGVLLMSGMSLGNYPRLPPPCEPPSFSTPAGVSPTLLAHLADKLHLWCRKAGAGGADGPRRPALDPEPPRDTASLVRLLLRIRGPRAHGRRCLYIPSWLFRAAEIEPPAPHAEFLDNYEADLEARDELYKILEGYRWPEADADHDSDIDHITLSRHGFRVIQCRVFKLFCFWRREAHFRRDLRLLEDEAIYRASWLDARLRATNDVATVAHWFFAYQRRLQRKVVSDEHWTRFLAKGEGAKLYQNSPRTVTSTFERVLARLAGQQQQSSDAGQKEEEREEEDTLGMIDQTCVMMKAYVDVYGGGDKANLVFTKGVRGGSGRGPVDHYNLLCDILAELTARARDAHIDPLPGPVYKFLAKDIMSWNNAWADDAFAGGKEHGWEDWLRKRGLDSTRYPAKMT